MTDDNRDLRPVRAIRLLHDEDWWLYSFDAGHHESVWRFRGQGPFVIRHTAFADTYRLYQAGELVQEFDTLPAAQERGVDLETGR